MLLKIEGKINYTFVDSFQSFVNSLDSLHNQIRSTTSKTQTLISFTIALTLRQGSGSLYAKGKAHRTLFFVNYFM